MSEFQHLIINNTLRRTDSIDGEYFGLLAGNTVSFEIKGVPYEFKLSEYVKGFDVPTRINISGEKPLAVRTGEQYRQPTAVKEWLTTPDQLQYGQSGIKILAHQYNKLKKKVEAGDYSDGTFGSSHEECKIQCHTRLETLRHVFEMLCVPESFTDSL